jgi:uncharacterized protein YdeI (YjbR/CyaY-like superfamily)
MTVKDPRVSAYIREAPEFARPILEELRTRIHVAVPGLEETLKWSSPFFVYDGKLLMGMAAFKQHCSFGFWHAAMRGSDTSAEGMGRFKPKTLAELPTKAEFERLARDAKRMVDENVASKRPPPKPRAAIPVPEDFQSALAKNRKALATFEGFSPTKRRDYLEWITEAKRAETRAARISQSVAWLAEGKARHWKYETKA